MFPGAGRLLFSKVSKRWDSSLIDGITITTSNVARSAPESSTATMARMRFFNFNLYWKNLTNGWHMYAISQAIKNGRSALRKTISRYKIPASTKMLIPIRATRSNVNGLSNIESMLIRFLYFCKGNINDNNENSIC